VETYNTDISPDYDCPTSYVRYARPTLEELRDGLEYVIDAEDEIWLRNNSKFGGSVPTATTAKRDVALGAGVTETNLLEHASHQSAASPGTIPLPISMLEVMLDLMEKATGFDAIITMDQAELLIVQRLPELFHMYPATKGRAGVVTLRHVISEVYQYWVSKRGKLKRPLLRRFWPVTSTDDTNPHLVFRPREKEKYKLRKKRQNDLEAHRKMQQLKQDFAEMRQLLLLVKQREELNRSLVLLQKEWFEQKLYDAVDTSGLCRVSQELDRRNWQELLQVEKHFDVHDGASGGWKRKKARRGSQLQQGAPGGSGTTSKTASRSATPIPESSAINSGLPGSGIVSGQHSSAAGRGPGNEATRSQQPMIIAGQYHGGPAPNFVQPLPTREAYATTWEGATPHVTTLVDGKAEPTFRFRHRPRVGRGGRLCIDRMPLPTDPDVAPNIYFRAGGVPTFPRPPKERLLDLLPQPINREALSLRIEDICLNALKEEYDAQETASGLASPPGSAAALAAMADNEENDGRAVVVKMKDWLNTDDQLWGEERYAIGPI
jgi:enhancer of polycomb-like protein